MHTIGHVVHHTGQLKETTVTVTIRNFLSFIAFHGIQDTNESIILAVNVVTSFYAHPYARSNVAQRNELEVL